MSAIRAAGIVLIEGPEGCGKASLGLRLAGSAARLEDPAAAAAGDVDPAALLRGPSPRLITEWWHAPTVLHHALSVCINTRGRGLFVFTGSLDEAPGVTGPVRRVRMRPMALCESGDSTSEASLAGLFAGEPVVAARADTGLDDIAGLVCRGGWPSHLGLASAAAAARGRLADVVAAASSPAGGSHSPAIVARLLTAIAAHSAAAATPARLAAAGPPMHRHTARACLATLRRLHIVEDQPAFAPPLRTAAAAHNSPRRHLADPSLAAAALGVSPGRLAADPRLLLPLFKSLVVRDLRVLAQPLGGRVMHFGDAAGRQADAAITDTHGRLLVVRIVLGGAAVDAAAADLRRVASALAPSACTGPPRLAVICAVGSGRHLDGDMPVSVMAATAVGP